MTDEIQKGDDTKRHLFIPKGVVDREATYRAAHAIASKGEAVWVHNHSYSVRCNAEEFGCEWLSPEQSNELTDAPG